MADSKITALTALTAADPINDMLPIVDVSDTTMAASGTTKKISVNNILGASGTATLASATITGDLTVDTSTLKVDSTNNRVGINKASPAYALDVVGNATISSTAGNNNWFYIAGNGNTVGATSFDIGQSASNEGYVFNRANGPIIFGVNNTTAMTLNSTGLGIGVTPGSAIGNLQVGGSTNANLYTQQGTDTIRIGVRASGRTGIILDSSNATYTNRAWYLDNAGSSGSLIIGRQGLDVITFDNVGNVGIGVTPSAWATYKAVSVGGIGASVFGLGSSQAGVAQGAFFNNGAGSGWAYSATSQVPTYYLQINGENIWNIAPSGTAGAQITAWTSAMKLDASGNLILLSSNTPATLTTNGQLTVNATSNTNLRFSYRGSDGTTRVANITLA